MYYTAGLIRETNLTSGLLMVVGAIFGFKWLRTPVESKGPDCFLCLGIGEDVLEETEDAEEEDEELWEGMKQTGVLCDLLNVGSWTICLAKRYFSLSMEVEIRVGSSSSDCSNLRSS